MDRRLSKSDLSKSAVLAQLGISGSLSRTELARDLGMSPASVTQIVKELISSGLIVEAEVGESTGGRPAMGLSLATDAGSVVGVKVVSDHLTFVESSVDGSVIRSQTDPFDSSSPNALARLVEACQRFVECSKEVVIGLGVAVPGHVVDPSDGIIESFTLGWQSAAVGSRLEAALGLPVVVENNVNAVASAEQLYGVGRKFDHYLLITIGTGIGLALVSEGTVIRGSNGAAGEMGHVQVRQDGLPCTCGKRGCLEAEIGQFALESQGRKLRLINENQGINDIAESARKGSRKATELFEEAAKYLGFTTGNLANLFDPQALVILGEGAENWDLWGGSFSEAFKSAALHHAEGVPVLVENWTDVSWAQGAAALVLASSRVASSAMNPRSLLIRRRLSESGGVPR